MNERVPRRKPRSENEKRESPSKRRRRRRRALQFERSRKVPQESSANLDQHFDVRPKAAGVCSIDPPLVGGRPKAKARSHTAPPPPRDPPLPISSVEVRVTEPISSSRVILLTLLLVALLSVTANMMLTVILTRIFS